MSDMFLGHSAQYWLDLQRRTESAVPEVPALLEEIISLRGKVGFYESRIREMAAVAK